MIHNTSKGTLIYIFAVVICSCSRPSEQNEADSVSAGRSSDMTGLIVSNIQPQSGVRTLSEISVDSIRIFTDSDSVPLFNPGLIGGDNSGNIFVFDYGDYKLKRYSGSGADVTVYGGGRGSGPGEFLSGMGIHTIGDSLVAVLDMYGHKVEIFSYEGILQSTIRIDENVMRFSFGETGFQYYMGFYPDYLIKSVIDNKEYVFPALDPSTTRNRLQYDGFIEATDHGVVYTPFKFGLILHYDSLGNQIYAVDTIGLSSPPDRDSSIEDSRSISISSKYLYVQARNTLPDDSTNTVIDIYDISSGVYDHSFKLPLRSRLSIVKNHYIYSLQDTTIAISYVSGI